MLAIKITLVNIKKGDIMYIDFNTLGKRIAQRRLALGYKQNELAEKADLSNNYLSNIENGHSIPSLKTFANICIQLETTPDMFLLGTVKTNDVPQSIIDNLKLCNNQSLKLIDEIIQCVLNQQKQ